MRSVTLHNRTYAIGFQWYSDKLKLERAELRRLAQKEDASLDMVAYRQGQYAFGESGGDVTAWRGVRALAGAAQMTDPSFLGLFRLEDRDGQFWWVFGMSQSLVVGMGDQVFTQRAEAEAWIQSLGGLVDTFKQTVICETVQESVRWLSALVPTFAFPLLPGRRGGYLTPLQPVPSQRRNRLIAATVMLALILGGYALKLFLEHQAGKRAMEATRVAMLNKEQRRREILARPEEHFPRPWLAVADIRETMLFGLKAMLTLPTSANGWLLEKASFDGRSVDASWAHRPGADYAHPPFQARLENPQKALSRIAVAPSSRRQPDSPLATRQACTQRLYQITQSMGGHLKLTFHAQETRLIDGIEIACPWLRGQWDLGDIPAAVILDGSLPVSFTSMPGLVLESMVQEKGTWTFKGVIYAFP